LERARQKASVHAPVRVSDARVRRRQRQRGV
jgi:hypothetical protein